MKKFIMMLLLLAVMLPAMAEMEIETNIDRYVRRNAPASGQDSTVAVQNAPVAVETEIVRDDNTKYVLMSIPDSLAADVRQLLRGNRKVVRDESKVDLDELVIYKGDTIPMVLKDLKLGRYDRGLYNFLFIPKGMWSIGLTASYGKFSTSDLQLFDVLSDVNISAHALSIRPYFSYAFKNNITAGLRLEYSNMQGNIDNLKLDIDEDMNFSIDDVMYRSQSYSAALLLTQYIGLSRRGRFGVFNEAQLKFTSGTSDFNRPYNSELKMTHSNDFEASLTYSPGLCVFVMPNVSANVSFGVFGFYIRKIRQWEDGVYSGSRLTSGANFRFNIFNISFGLAVHI